MNPKLPPFCLSALWMAWVVGSALLLHPVAVEAQIQPYYSDNLTTVDLTKWTQNGLVYPTPTGITNSNIYGGSLISSIAVPGGGWDYEVKSTLTIPNSGGAYEGYIQYLRASSNALSGTESSQGSYYAAELQSVTWNGGSCTAALAVYKRFNNVITLLGSKLVSW